MSPGGAGVDFQRTRSFTRHFNSLLRGTLAYRSPAVNPVLIDTDTINRYRVELRAAASEKTDNRQSNY